MALRILEIGLLLFLVAMLWGGVAAQSSCNRVIMGMASCLNYITGNSSTPSSSCCSQLASVAQSQPQCLCSLLNGSGVTLGITINQTLGLALPGACYVQTSPVSQCNAASGPRPTTSATPPGSSPADSSDDTSEVPTPPPESGIPSGSKTVPSTYGSSSDGGIMDSPFHFVVLLFITSCVLTLTGFCAFRGLL